MIRRLSKHRVDALNEAGHIPAKLVKTAIAYYEYDKKRMEFDEQIKQTIYSQDRKLDFKQSKPGLLRRLAIFLGRA